jgi:hypothetical protein
MFAPQSENCGNEEPLKHTKILAQGTRSNTKYQPERANSSTKNYQKSEVTFQCSVAI